MPLESDGCARVNISEVQELKQLIFRRGLVVGQVGRSQDEPTLLPSLVYMRDTNPLATREETPCRGGSEVLAHLSTLAFFPQVTGFDDAFVARPAPVLRLAPVAVLECIPIILRFLAHQWPFSDRVQGRLGDIRSVDRTAADRGGRGDNQVFGREDRIRVRFCAGDGLLGRRDAGPQILLRNARER